MPAKTYSFLEIDICFSTLLLALVVAATGVAVLRTSAPLPSRVQSLTAKNYYSAPIAPWKAAHHPGCTHLIAYQCPSLPPPLPHNPPHTPPPPLKHPQTDGFYDLKCAAQDDYSYLTYGLVDTIEAMCDSVAGCVFINTYHDVNEKVQGTVYESTSSRWHYHPCAELDITCTLFSKCLTAVFADNCEGQSQLDGSIDYITNSNAYCKKY
ncbi:hypothetical protein B0H14DRAFT_3497408 [Mycena olivaceomarginata]|nr:hypothetical protein B0H14DRAFT_3497408 [Mycena olivaceomarginata]